MKRTQLATLLGIFSFTVTASANFATEMLEALGVPTSKSFSLIETGEELFRGDEPSPTRSSVLVRLGHSHVRFGTFQRQAYERSTERLQKLLDFALEHYFPTLKVREGQSTPQAFFEEVSRRTAALAASFGAAGFVHGVLNTDNLNITGESFDYGPYRFLPEHDRQFVAAYFDSGGRYAFGRQAEAMRFGLERLADTLSALCPAPQLVATLHDYEPRHLRYYHRRFLNRLGLSPKDPVSDSLLVSRCVCFLEESHAGYDQFFFDWYAGEASAERASKSPAASLYQGDKLAAVRRTMEPYEPAFPERLQHPYFKRPSPCSMLIDEIEAIWAAIAERDDWSAFERKIEDVRVMGEALGNKAASRGSDPDLFTG